MTKSLVAAAAIGLLFGMAKLPLEHSLEQEDRAAFFHGAKLSLGLRDQVGQLGFLAALSGFRSLVADFLWIEAHTAWEGTQWARMALLFNNVTTLQPRVLMFWDMAAWHMAYNASVAAFNDRRQPRKALRLRAQREYFELGKDFLVRGIENNPDRYLLYERLGIVERDKFGDHFAAATRFGQAAAIPGAPAYDKRFTAYELSHCPGHEREAYERLLALYRMGKQEWLPTLLERLGYLQAKLNVPEAQRVYIPPIRPGQKP